MRIAYIDCFSGISGDMFLGALLDAGVPEALLTEAVTALNIGARLQISRVNRSGITATKVEVCELEAGGATPGSAGAEAEDEALPRPASGPRNAATVERTQPAVQLREHNYGKLGSLSGESPIDHQEASSSGPGAAARAPGPAEHNPLGDQRTSQAHAHAHSRSGHPTRGLGEIRRIIQAAAIDGEAKLTALAIFEALGAAEAKIHDLELHSVHFHEVGAVDSLADIVGAAVGVRALGVDEIVCSPLNLGGGTVRCAHGLFPVPAPATLELLKQAPVYSSGVQAELVTPTGAAIVRTLARRFSAFPAMRIERIGYGAGTRDLARQANVVRLTIGEQEPVVIEGPSERGFETISILEANIDDLNPQVFGYVIDRLMAEGALDVFGLPVQMKKNRPGMLLTVLCQPQDGSKLTQLLFAETTTLGIRSRQERRETLDRSWVSVPTRWGDVRFKVASRDGRITNYAPEYEDCKRIAREHRVPLKNVMQEALQGYSRSQPGGGE